MFANTATPSMIGQLWRLNNVTKGLAVSYGSVALN